MRDELEFHVERQTEANIAQGMSLDEARRAARIATGRVDDALEGARHERPGSMLKNSGRDIRYGARLLAKSPAFGVAGVTIIALGIGAVTAVSSVVYGVMLLPLPFRNADRLVTVWTTSQTLDANRLYPNAADAYELKNASHVFDDVALVRTTANLNLVGGGEPERLQGARFSPNLLSVLGVAPAIGRGFSADEDRPGRDQVVLLSDGLWRRRFGADTSIVGRSVQLNGLPHTVIGVMPADFQYPTRDYVAWVPLVVGPKELSREDTQNYVVVGRLRSGATVEGAQRDLEVNARRLEVEHPETNRGHGVFVESMLDNATHDVRPRLITLLAAAGCLLLIACLNLSNLVGARAAARSGEFAVRLALGASRARIASQAIAEVVPMLLLGGVAGVLAAAFGVRAFVAAAPPGVPRLDGVGVSLPVIVVSLAILVLSGVIASVIPALGASRADYSSMMRDGGRGSTVGRRRADARRIGVAGQIAFAIPLLVGASLLVRSAIELAAVDLGFAPGHTAIAHLAVSRSKYASDDDVASYYDKMLMAIVAIPGVTHAGLVNRLPLDGSQTMTVHVEPTPGQTLEISAIDSRSITPGYFAALGIALRGGRVFSSADDRMAPSVAIVDDRLARTIWPNQNVVGKRIQRFDGVWCTIVGVVAHIHANGVDVDPRPQVYWSYRQATYDRMVLAVRTNGDARAMLAPTIAAIHAVDADQPVYDVRTMDEIVDRSLVQRRLTTSLIASFGAIALLLAAVGVYGVVAFGVTQRVREFGVRVALGATPGALTRLVVRDGLSMAFAGLVVGLAISFALSRVMTGLVYGISARDATSTIAGTLSLLLAVTLASYIPARRAAAIDPAVTLRSD
jgi:putative ABC transport system permease protein